MTSTTAPEKVPATSRQPAETARQQAQLPTVQPYVDVIDRGEELLVVADLPGCDDRSVEITLDQGVLTIRATPDYAAGDEDKAVLREFRPVTYQRGFTVGEGVEIERAEASVRDGVLRLRVPKSPAAKPRRIQVKS